MQYFLILNLTFSSFMHPKCTLNIQNSVDERNG